ncbi:CsgE family curli-type amyloid fiber assembly protein [uncultured Neptuniibacter sp.]|uniref:CsgE family curli-type amyloid fiber assembly protein n=1 Tax=uncultured Neptuniibacter sp. TaxID=502143 RepID=UPI00261AB0BF|nr:CsgE family curli-type amyloid fiber assembly protein [uncultured Neptuniibacter sp.]
MRKKGLLVMTVISFLWPPMLSSQGLEDEIKGFTTDNTITRIGHDFTRYLSDYRHTHIPDGEYNLSIFERPSARWGNLIWVEKDHKTVYRRFLSPSSTNLQREAEQAARQIDKRVKQLELKALFSDTFDIDKDEL